MRYTKNLPQTDKALSNQLVSNGWKKLKEPSHLTLAILFSMPFVFLLSGSTLWMAYLLNPALFGFIHSESLKISFSINFNTLLYVVVIFIFMFIHELVHLIGVPKFIKSDQTFIGINGLFGFVSTREVINKGRFIIVSIMPYILLSVIFLAVLHILGWLNWYTLILCLVNAAGSCVDFLNVMLVTFQVPNGSMIINNGFETYYSSIRN